MTFKKPDALTRTVSSLTIVINIFFALTASFNIFALIHGVILGVVGTVWAISEGVVG